MRPPGGLFRTKRKCMPPRGWGIYLCNVGLGMLGDSRLGLARADSYLRMAEALAKDPLLD